MTSSYSQLLKAVRTYFENRLEMGLKFARRMEEAEECEHHWLKVGGVAENAGPWDEYQPPNTQYNCAHCPAHRIVYGIDCQQAPEDPNMAEELSVTTKFDR